MGGKNSSFLIYHNIFNFEVSVFKPLQPHMHFFLFPFQRFKDIFQEVYESNWKTKFEEAGIWYVVELAPYHNANVCSLSMNFA